MKSCSNILALQKWGMPFLVSLMLTHAAESKAEAGPNSDKLRAVLEARLSQDHPIKTGGYEITSSTQKGRKPNQTFDPLRAFSISYQIDDPKFPSKRAVLGLDVYEFKDPIIANRNFWMLQESGAVGSSTFFDNPHGFDLLSIFGTDVHGLVGKYVFKCTINSREFASSHAHPNPDYGWNAGLAEFALDVWNEAQGLPHHGGSIVPVAPGKMMTRLGRNDPALELPQTQEEINTVPPLPMRSHSSTSLAQATSTSFRSMLLWLLVPLGGVAIFFWLLCHRKPTK